MALEDLTGSKTIESMVRTNPTNSDPKSEGDDHFRGMKNVILNTFPNVTGVVSATHTALNQAASRPAFFVHRNGVNTPSQNVGVDTKIQFNTEDFDTHTIYDHTTNFRADIGEAGIYLIGFSISPASKQDDMVITNSIRINGSAVRNGVSLQGAAAGIVNSLVMTLQNLAVNDTVEFYANIINGLNTAMDGAKTVTWAFGVRVA